MADDVIKNPLRTMPRPQVPYEPEHVRHGVNVQPAPGTATPQRKVVPTKDKIEDDVWASLDGESLDDDGNAIPFQNGHIIDNNDYVNLGFDSPPPRQSESPPPEENTAEVFLAPQVGNYILMVLGKLVTVGSIESIQAKVKNIMYGDDPAFAALEISMDDIVVLKRVNIKVGIFIDG